MVGRHEQIEEVVPPWSMAFLHAARSTASGQAIAACGTYAPASNHAVMKDVLIEAVEPMDATRSSDPGTGGNGGSA